MKAMVLAAGKGKRLFPLTGEIPKPLALIAGIPIIQHVFNLLAAHSISKIYVNVHYLADALLEAYGGASRMNNGATVCLRREEALVGTAGSVKCLAGEVDDTFLVVMGDALTDINVGELVAFHKKKAPSPPSL